MAALDDARTKMKAFLSDMAALSFSESTHKARGAYRRRAALSRTAVATFHVARSSRPRHSEDPCRSKPIGLHRGPSQARSGAPESPRQGPSDAVNVSTRSARMRTVCVGTRRTVRPWRPLPPAPARRTPQEAAVQSDGHRARPGAADGRTHPTSSLSATAATSAVIGFPRETPPRSDDDRRQAFGDSEQR